MIPIPAILLSVLFMALSAVHIVWAFGDKLGKGGAVPTVDGRPLFEPGKALTLLVAAALLAGALISVWLGAFPEAAPVWVPRIGIWIIAVSFLLRAIGDFHYVGFFKRVRNTRFARNDSLFFSPLCIVIAALATWLAATNQ